MPTVIFLTVYAVGGSTFSVVLTIMDNAGVTGELEYEMSGLLENNTCVQKVHKAIILSRLNIKLSHLLNIVKSMLQILSCLQPSNDPHLDIVVEKGERCIYACYDYSHID